MRKILIILSFFSLVSYTQAQTKKRTYVAKPSFDSATYYYNLGWDSYKMDSLGDERYGPARYYWERASQSVGKWESKNAALYRLGLMQQNGEGVDVNLSMAMDYFLKASGSSKRYGDADAIKNIGGMYENGFGVDQNFAKALSWYIKAKAAGNQNVDEDISRLKERLRK